MVRDDEDNVFSRSIRPTRDKAVIAGISIHSALNQTSP